MYSAIAFSLLQRFALKPEPRDFLKALQSNAFKKSLGGLFMKTAVNK
jgi:hypothetical protein